MGRKEGGHLSSKGNRLRMAPPKPHGRLKAGNPRFQTAGSPWPSASMEV
jgi:hypothetical protein